MSKKWSRQTVSQCCGQPHKVCARSKQVAPWQFNKLQRHLGVITLPLVTVIVIISGPNICSVLISHHGLCSILYVDLSFSQYHRLISQRWSLPPLDFLCQCSALLISSCFHSFPSLTYLFHLQTHYKAAFTVNNNIHLMKPQKNVCPPPHRWTK